MNNRDKLKLLLHTDGGISFNAAKSLALSGDHSLIPELYALLEKSLEGSENWGDVSSWRRPAMIERVIISLMTIEECREALRNNSTLSRWELEMRVWEDRPIIEFWQPQSTNETPTEALSSLIKKLNEKMGEE